MAELGENIFQQQCTKCNLQRGAKLIDDKFDKNTIVRLLDDFESRNDDEIRSIVTDNADIPTIFEYVLGI